MAKVYGLTKKDRDLVQAVIKRVGAGKGVLSKRPAPTRRRRRAGSSGGGSSLRWGSATTNIDRRTTGSYAVADFGEGEVQFYDTAGDEDGEPVLVLNPFHVIFYGGSDICVDDSFSPPRVVSGTCGVGALFPDEDEE